MSLLECNRCHTPVIYHDLNKDGKEDAIVSLKSSGGGSSASNHGFIFIKSNDVFKQVSYFQNYIDIGVSTSNVLVCETNPNHTGGRWANLFDVTEYEISSSGVREKNQVRELGPDPSKCLDDYLTAVTG